MLEEIRPPRRAVIVSAGLGALATAVAACGAGGKAPAPGSDAAGSTPGSLAAAGSGALAKTADVPVGAGVIVSDVVITQPSAGVFKGFSSVCTHAGCHVSQIADGKIICPCHGSEFNLDGTVARGPAREPLEAKPVTVQGDSIVAG